MNSLDINAEDFQSSVDFLSNLGNVDSEKISIIGIFRIDIWTHLMRNCIWRIASIGDSNEKSIKIWDNNYSGKSSNCIRNKLIYKIIH